MIQNSPTPEQHQGLEYCINMLSQMNIAARAGGYTVLEYLISMALAEAIDIQRGVRPAAPKTSLGP